MPKTTQSNQRAAQIAAAANYGEALDDKRDLGASIQYAFIDVPVDIANVAGDVITLLELPLGATVIPELSSVVVTGDFSSAAATMHIGDVLDPDRYAAALNVAAAATTPLPFCGPVNPDSFANRHKVTAATKLVTATIVTATILAGSFRVNLAYSSL